MDSERTPVPVKWPATVDLIDGPTSHLLRSARIESDAALVAHVRAIGGHADDEPPSEEVPRCARHLLVRVRTEGSPDIVFRACRMDFSRAPFAAPKWLAGPPREATKAARNRAQSTSATFDPARSVGA